MRAVLASALLGAASLSARAQIGINTSGTTPAASAMLDLDAAALPATGKRGLLLPRMTAAERAAIPAPATGLTVYETTTNAFWYFNGTGWTQLFGPFTGWRIPGNMGIVAGAHFLGTTDAVPLEFRRNNVRSGWVSSASANTSWGYIALAVNTGTNNTALGSRALAASTSASRNTAVGSQALASNVDGSNNVAVGANALRVGTSVVAQTALGVGAMENYTGGAGNTAVGAYALTAATPTYCTAVGYRALNVCTGANNTACGYEALRDNTTGAGNTATGAYALRVQVTGNNNTAMYSMRSMTAGSNNTGLEGLQFAGSGSGNCAIGAFTLNDNTGDFNTALGHNAHTDNIAGDFNAALGSLALQHSGGTDPSSVNFCTAAGRFAYTSAIGNNMTSIGSTAVAPAANVIRFGNAANNTGLTGGFGAWQNLSDARFKKDVRENVPGLEFILRLRSVTYLFDVQAFDTFLGVADGIAQVENTEERADYIAAAQASSAVRRIGFIAQEVERAADAVGFAFSGVHKPIDERDHYTIGYEQFVVPLVKAVQEQQEQIEILRTEQAVIREALERTR